MDDKGHIQLTSGPPPLRSRVQAVWGVRQRCQASLPHSLPALGCLALHGPQSQKWGSIAPLLSRAGTAQSSLPSPPPDCHLPSLVLDGQPTPEASPCQERFAGRQGPAAVAAPAARPASSLCSLGLPVGFEKTAGSLFLINWGDGKHDWQWRDRHQSESLSTGVWPTDSGLSHARMIPHTAGWGQSGKKSGTQEAEGSVSPCPSSHRECCPPAKILDFFYCDKVYLMYNLPCEPFSVAHLSGT